MFFRSSADSRVGASPHASSHDPQKNINDHRLQVTRNESELSLQWLFPNVCGDSQPIYLPKGIYADFFVVIY